MFECLLLVLILFLVLSQQNKTDFTAFLKHSKIISKNQLSQIKLFEKQYQINLLYKQKLISNEQKKRLLQQLEKPAKKQSGQKLRHHIIAGGVVCILAGMIALIASNWQEISSIAKLTGYFIVFAALTARFAVLFMKNKKRELWLWLNVGWIFAGIALIGQIFHLNGSGWDVLFFGALLSTPFISLSRFKYAVSLWSVSYGTGVVFGSSPEWAFLWILAVLPIVLFFKNNKPAAWVWCVSLIVSILNTLWFSQLAKAFTNTFMPLAGAWIFLAVLFSIVCVCRRFIGSCAFTKVLRSVFYLICFGTLFGTDYTYSVQEVVLTPQKMLTSVWGVFILAALPFCAVGLFLKDKKTAYMIWAFSLILAFCYTFITFQSAGFILALIVFAVAALFFAHKQKTNSFYACLFLIVFRIWLQYFVYTVSLTGVGFGLIGIGLLLLFGRYLLSHPFGKEMQ